MSIHEPMTMATDYVLALVAAFFAASLWRRDVKLWSLAFTFTALASLLGGTHHGLAIELLWKPTLYAVGLASLFLLAGAARPLLFVAALKFAAYAVWIVRHDEFRFAILDYGLTLVFIGIAQAVAWFRHRAPSAPWVLGSIGVSVAGALVQQSGFALHRHFNHNDLYHLIQMAALWMLYRGGLLLTTSERDRARSRPT